MLKEDNDEISFLFFIWTLALSEKNIDDFDLIQSTRTDFDIIAVSESRLIKDELPPYDICLTNYSYEFFP